MAWVYLFFAGLLEILWAVSLKLSHGFTNIKFSILTIIGLVFSFVFLAQATKTLPLGTAYAIWTGIGALGAVIAGVIIFKEPLTLQRIFFSGLLLVALIGLKINSPS